MCDGVCVCVMVCVCDHVSHVMVHMCLVRSRFVSEGTSLVQRLALGSVQMFGMSRSAILPSPLPGVTIAGSLAAGLPHFSTGFMRCWGRDTFVALRGLLLSTSRYEDARLVLSGWGTCFQSAFSPE